VLFNPPGGVQFFKLSLELVNENVEVVKKSLSLGGFLLYFIYREVVNYLYIGFVPVSGHSV